MPSQRVRLAGVGVGGPWPKAAWWGAACTCCPLLGPQAVRWNPAPRKVMTWGSGDLQT